jgi:oxygen-independent coproporphyrinogen-3 oxidase
MFEREKLSIYIHIPFCRKRCNYCDFNTYAGMGVYLAEYVEQVEREIEVAASAIEEGSRVHTVYFGGGTPTLMPPDNFRRLLDRIHQCFNCSDDLEVSSEANPYLLTMDYLQALRGSGIKRLSMGMQSADEAELKLLGRIHQLADVEQSMELARRAGIYNINLDLIFGIPGQSMRSFRDSVGKALALSPQHLSIYSLTVEEGTPLERMIAQGQVPRPDADLAADMYAWVMDYLAGQDYGQYEISNWAIEEKYRCRHNLQYWYNRDYLGLGAGAHSHYKDRRWANVNAIPDYISLMKSARDWNWEKPPASVEVRKLSVSDDIQESMMMGLRLVEEGISRSGFHQRFGQRLEEVYPQEVNDLVREGLLETADWRGDEIIRLTTRGRMLGNQVFMQFIDA